MDLWQLHVFSKVIELKSFSRAGDVIHLSQPTVSSHIKDLEDHFGCRLIDRMSKEAVPTRAGELLYAYARRMLALRDEAEAGMAEFQGRLVGRLSIGASTTPGSYLLPRIIGSFKKQFPEVTVWLAIGDSQKIIQDTLDGELEMGVVGAAVKMKYLVQEKLTRDRMRLIVPADHPFAGREKIAFEALASAPFILREPGSGTRKSLQGALAAMEKGLEDLMVVAQMGSTPAVVQGIKSRIGLSILSHIAVADDLARGALAALDVEGLDLGRHFYLCRHRNRSFSPMGLAFAQFLKETLNSTP